MFGSTQTQSEPYQVGGPLLMTRDARPVASERIFCFGRSKISIAHREITVGDEVRPLQPLPFDLLVYLIDNRERVVSTDELLDRFWPNEFVQPGTVASAIARARKAIADADAQEAIRTYCRVGYRFVAPLLLA